MSKPITRSYLEGRSNDIQGAMQELAAEWASIPNPRTGRSNYGSGNAAGHTVEQLMEALQNARQEYGINIQTGHLSDVCQKFDLITMFHALEHIPNPVKTFKLLYQLLNKDGILFIEVPNIETKDASPHNIYFKAHIHYFSASTLTSAASQYFEKIDEVRDSNLQILFRRKDIVEDNILFPSLGEVNQTASRLKKKGWFEYITYGHGYKKLPLRIKQLFIESRLNYESGIKVLNDILREK